MTTPMLRIPLIAAITAEVSYMPAKAVVVQLEPKHWLQKPAAVAASMSMVATAGRPFCVDLGMKVS